MNELYLNKVYKCDANWLLNKIDKESIDLIFIDPPFNLNKPYSGYYDNVSTASYLTWTKEYLQLLYNCLKPTGTIFVCMCDELGAEVKLLLKDLKLYWRNDIIWHYTFGEQQKLKFSRCHTNIYYFTKHADTFTFNTDSIRVPSARQLKYNDIRANPKGKVPDDVWWFGDVFKDSRICGTFKERNEFKHPCQMPESLLDRIVLAASNENDVVLDCFGGSGTTAFCAKKHKRNFITCDTDITSAKCMARRLFENEGQFLIPTDNGV